MQVPTFVRGKKHGEMYARISTQLDQLSFQTVPYSDWAEFLAAADQVFASVVISAGSQPQVNRRIAALREETPVGIVWIQMRERGSHVELVYMDGVVTLPSDTTQPDATKPSTTQLSTLAFPIAYRRALTHGVLRTRASRLDGLPNLSQLLKRSCEVALLADPPIRSSKSFATACHCETAQLQYRFRASGTVTRPTEMLQWVLLVHISLRMPVGLNLDWLAEELQTNVQRLRRITQKLLGTTPAEVAADFAPTIQAFDDYLLRSFSLPPADYPPLPRRA